MTTTAHLGGIPLILSGGASWSMTSGTTPQRAEFEIAAFDEGRAQELAKSARNAVTLELAGRTFAGLSVLHVLPSTVTAKRRVVVVDRRHWWERKHYYRAVNMPRRVGQVRRDGVGWNESMKALPGLTQFAPGFTFYTHSLKSPTEAWAPLSLWEDIIQSIDPGASLLMADGLDLNGIPLQGLELDGNGQEVTQQALARLGAVDLTINPLGQVVLYSWRARSELGIMGPGDSSRQYGSVGPGIWARGTAEVVSFSAEAPEYVDVLFTPEIEVMFRFVADPTDPDETSFQGPQAVEPTFVNVIVNPIQELPISDEVTLTSGDYIEITRALVAYTALAASGGAPGNMPTGLSLAHLRQAILPRNGAILHRALDTLISKSPSTLAVNWSEIVGALTGGFRQLWQLPQEWVNNSLSIQPYLVGTWNTESGQRASSVVWCDHTIFPNAQGRWIYGKTADKMPWCIEVSTSYPGTDTDPTATNPPGPFSVEVKDRDQGIIATPQSVATATQNKALIGLMTNLPSGAIRASNKGAVFLNSAAIGDPTGSLPSISTSMRMATILTLTPARVLTRVTVRPADIGITWAATGPPMEVRAREETARYGWSQQRKKTIMDVFGLSGATTREVQDIALRSDAMTEACVNLKDNNKGAASLTAIAHGYALDVYSRFEPRLMGSRVADLRGPAADAVPGGGIASVTHSVDGRGVATTSIMLRVTRPALNLLSLLPSAARAIIMRLIPWKQGQ